ncbi:MAG: gamma-glutamyltransferase family protein [Firmicutes bacterium]|nr:gamma-glutamyltransferase family protein [Bacillota bacterium]
MHFSFFQQPYPSRRSPVLGLRGAVATSQPLAALAGIRMLLAGGNAVDAAIATAAALTVVEPTSNGLGSDAFALVWDGHKLHGLNGSGRTPQALTPEVFARRGLHQVPSEGWLPITVPGAISAWVELAHRFGSMPLTEVLRPAIEYAEQGSPVSPVIAGYWKAAERRFRRWAEAGAPTDSSGDLVHPFSETFLVNGRAPRPGEVFRCPDLGRSLRLIAESKGEAFYRGGLAERIASWAAATGGFITRDDLARHRAEWVEPISTSYRGFDIWEIPPNGQGLAALMALNILEGFDMARLPHLSAHQLHLLIEALKLSFADAYAYIADPAVASVPTEALLDKGYAQARRALIRQPQTWRDDGEGEGGCLANPSPTPGLPQRADTVYLCTADGEGRLVSFIQSNYMGFGSGVVVPGTGISLQNRGACFTLQEGHPNRLAPGKRPFHTIIPGFISRSGVPLAAFGVMGGDMQPQGHVQVVVGVVDYGLNPQAAIDAPRLRVLGGPAVALESVIPAETARQLARWGHHVRVDPEMAGFGGGQMIWRDPESGVLIAGSEPRKDGAALAL